MSIIEIQIEESFGALILEFERQKFNTEILVRILDRVSWKDMSWMFNSLNRLRRLPKSGPTERLLALEGPYNMDHIWPEAVWALKEGFLLFYSLLVIFELNYNKLCSNLSMWYILTTWLTWCHFRGSRGFMSSKTDLNILDHTRKIQRLPQMK